MYFEYELIIELCILNTRTKLEGRILVLITNSFQRPVGDGEVERLQNLPGYYRYHRQNNTRYESNLSLSNTISYIKQI